MTAIYLVVEENIVIEVLVAETPHKLCGKERMLRQEGRNSLPIPGTAAL